MRTNDRWPRSGFVFFSIIIGIVAGAGAFAQSAIYQAPPVDVEIRALEDIRQACLPEVRAWYPSGWGGSADRPIRTVDDWGGWDRIREFSSNRPDEQMRRMTEADITQFERELNGDEASARAGRPVGNNGNGNGPLQRIALQRCAFHRRLCQVGRARYCGSAALPGRTAASPRPNAVASRPAVTPPPAAPPRQHSPSAGITMESATALSRAGDYAGAIRQFQILAAQGEARAQYVLGYLLVLGRRPRPEDLPSGLRYLQQSAAQNYQPAITALAELERRRAQQVPAGQAQAAAADPTPSMLPEIAAAWRAATDPAVRTRIERNAARYAASRPSLVVRANSGSGCIRPSMTNVSFEPDTGNWTAIIRLTNGCGTEQFAYTEERLTPDAAVGMPLTNVGMFRGRWDTRRDPQVGFRPWNPAGETPRFRLAPGAEISSIAQVYYGDRSNQVELWIGSCPSHAAGNVSQIGFRPTAYMRDDPRLVCVPGVQGPDRY